MNRSEFLAKDAVILFVDWAVRRLPYLKVQIDISARGTGRAQGQLGPGVRGQYVGLSSVVEAYRWRSEWTDERGMSHCSEDWPTTREALNKLSVWLREELRAGDSESVLAACNEICRWGGDRTLEAERGAIGFLKQQKDPRSYLLRAQEALLLQTADTERFDVLLDMNSMLTKIHALAAEDGLPIYDSRVAGAIGSLVEIFRQESLIQDLELLAPLAFGPVSSETRRAPAGLGDGYARPRFQVKQSRRSSGSSRGRVWGSCKVRLGWLIEEIIRSANQEGVRLFSPSESGTDSIAQRMHAFEAALFMIGFDVACL